MGPTICQDALSERFVLSLSPFLFSLPSAQLLSPGLCGAWPFCMMIVPLCSRSFFPFMNAEGPDSLLLLPFWFLLSLPLCIPCFLFLYPGFPMFVGLWLYH